MSHCLGGRTKNTRIHRRGKEMGSDLIIEILPELV